MGDKWHKLGDKVLRMCGFFCTFAVDFESDMSIIRGRAGWSRNGRENERKTKRETMIAELIIPIETLKGQLRKDGYYFRMYKGKQIVQRCPNRSEHVKKEGEAENQQRFIERYRKKKAGTEERL